MILYVDTKILKNNVNPSIKESKKKLNSAKGIVSKIKVPEGFASTNKLKKSIPKRITDVDTDMGDLYKFVSKKIDLFTNAGKNIISMGKTNILKFGVKITASSVNECLSLVKGLGNFAESLLDTGATIAAVGVTPIAGLSDLINYLTGNEASAVDELWRGTKGLIANEVVNSAFKDLYENYEFGKWLDENAFKPYKSTGAIPRLTEGIGELAGTALLAFFTAGTGAAANPATASKLFTLLRGLTGAGKALQDYWSESSGDLEGIENLVDTLKGLGYGTLTGGWEALQAHIGGDTLKGIEVLKSQLLNSLVRIGIDTGFNMADTPYRSLMDVIFKGKEWDEAWKDQGGWTSLLINGGIALLGSTFGEYFDYKNKMDVPDDEGTSFIKEQTIGNYNDSSKQSLLKRLKNLVFGEKEIKELNMSKFNTEDINFQNYNEAKEAFINNFFEKNRNVLEKNGCTRETVEEYFNKALICSDKEYFNKVKKFYGHPAECTAFNFEGWCFLPDDLSSKDIAHEFVHSTGNLYTGASGNKNMEYIALNEAFTEYTACSMGFKNPTTVAYSGNLPLIEAINKTLEEKGFKDCLLDGYTTRNNEYVKKTLNDLSGDDSFFDSLASAFKRNQDLFLDAYKTGRWTDYYQFTEETVNYIRQVKFQSFTILK